MRELLLWGVHTVTQGTNKSCIVLTSRRCCQLLVLLLP